MIEKVIVKQDSKVSLVDKLFSKPPVLNYENWIKQRQLDISTTNNCGMKCFYCISSNSNNNKNLSSYFEDHFDTFMKRFQEVFEPHFKNGFIVCIGGPGEPSASIRFIDLLEYLSKFPNLTVKIMTNYQNYSLVSDFLLKCKPKNKFLNMASFHLGQMINLGWTKNRIMEYAFRIQDLHNRGYKVGAINIPLSPNILTPENTEFALEVIGFLKMHLVGAMVHPVEMFGKIGDLPYPQSYTKAEMDNLELIHRSIGYNSKDHGVANANNRKEIDFDQNYQEMTKNSSVSFRLKGKLCSMSMMHYNMDLKGYLTNCQQEPVTKHIFIEDPKLTSENVFDNTIQRCETDLCVCKASGMSHCLGIHGVKVWEYDYAYNMDIGNEEKAKIFKKYERI